MEHISYKLSVLLAILIGAVYRVVRIKSKETTLLGKSIDHVTTFAISIIFALVLLNPVMSIFAISASADTLVAMMLALSAEAVMRKLLSGIEKFNFVTIIENYIVKKYGVNLNINTEEEKESKNK